MELSVTQENLTKALSAASQVATSRAGLPILGNILFRTEGTRLLIAATNLEIATVVYIGAKVVKQGSLTVPARIVSEFVASLPKGTISISVKKNRMSISAGTFNSVINGIDAEEFPELPSISAKNAVKYSINTNDFKQAVTQTIITSSSDTTRPVLTGVYWHSVDGSLYLAATDGYRLAEKKLLKTTSQISAIIPSSSLQEVLRAIHESTEEIEVLIDNSQVLFRVGDTEITSRLIDGNYPDYRQLIPSSSETGITLETSEFMRLVKIAGLFARESGGSITVQAEEQNQQLTIQSIASEYGENTSSAKAVITNDGQITLNSRYIIDALSVIDEPSITFRFSGRLAPCVISSSEKSSDYIHIIMPLKS